MSGPPDPEGSGGPVDACPSREREKVANDLEVLSLYSAPSLSEECCRIGHGDWDKLEELLAAYVPKGSRNRTNLTPDAPRDQWGAAG